MSDEPTLFCSACQQQKYASAFAPSVLVRRQKSCSGHCLECSRKQDKDWRQRNPEESRAASRRYHERLRAEMLAAYGSRCACCGELRAYFLTLDHVLGDGAAERGRTGAYMLIGELRRRGWPKDGYQLLCFNCNCAKRDRVFCPCSLEYVLSDEVRPLAIKESA